MAPLTRTEANQQRTGERGIPRGLTLLTISREGELRLAIKTARGVLDVPHAARLLNLHAPATMDDLLQDEGGLSVHAILTAAEASNQAQPAWLNESDVAYGPLVSRPEKIVCVGLNYRHHAQEIGAPLPQQPVLFSKYNNTLSGHQGKL